MDWQALRRSWHVWVADGDRPAGHWWIDVAWTLVFCLAVALGFTVLGMAARRGSDLMSAAIWLRWYGINLGIGLCVGFTIHGLFALGKALVGRARLRDWVRWKRATYYTVLPVVGVAIGWPLGLTLMLDVDVPGWLGQMSRNALITTFLLCVLITVLFQGFFSLKTQQIRAEKRATEAQLRLLQAQIEPHFLFNTLANVVSLVEADPPRARAMLESFVDYLRASLGGLGTGEHRLGDEIDLVEAYLKLIGMRMEERLRFAIDVPVVLRSLPVPPLSLQPLVENAVVHGLEPRIDGGSIRIAARLENHRLLLTVDDDGEGLAAAPGADATTEGGGVASPRRDRRHQGSGTALANIRERLLQAFGGDGELRLEPRSPCGTRAVLSLPAEARHPMTNTR